MLVNLDNFVVKFGFKLFEELFLVVGKEEFSLCNVEYVLFDVLLLELVFEVLVDFEKCSSGVSVVYGVLIGVLVVGVDVLLM